MAKLVRVIEEYNDEAFYISLNDKQFEFLQWLKERDYLNEDISFVEKNEVDEVLDLS